jgi:hypothetical protein
VLALTSVCAPRLPGPKADARADGAPKNARVPFLTMMPRAFSGESQPLKNLGTDQRSVPDPAGVEERIPPRQARTMGIATNFIASSDLTRISTACLPFFWASPTAVRTSAAVATIAPADFKDDVAALEPVLRGKPVRVDLSHDHSFGAAAGNFPSGSERQPKFRQARSCCVGVGTSRASCPCP